MEDKSYCFESMKRQYCPKKHITSTRMNEGKNIDIIFIDTHVHPLHLHAPFEFQSDFEN